MRTDSSRRIYELVKRGGDIVIGVGLLTLLAPCLLLVAVAVRFTSKGSAIYKQARVGRDGCLFMVWKFRTMTSNADQRGPLITAADDARVTRVGRFLRRSKIDELPQLWNVVKGEMSLVGPRPQVPHFVRAFPEEQRALILTVRPGITGPTQLAFRNEEQYLEGHEDREGYYITHLLPTKCRMDVEYVRARSLTLDLSVLVKTLLVVLNRDSKETLFNASQALVQANAKLLPRDEDYCEIQEKATVVR